MAVWLMPIRCSSPFPQSARVLEGGTANPFCQSNRQPKRSTTDKFDHGKGAGCSPRDRPSTKYMNDEGSSRFAC